MEHTNTLIIGAGPIGLELAIALKHTGVDYLHVDAGQIGQTISWYPKQARFFSSPERIGIAGVPLVTPDQSKATREQYLAYLRAVVQQFDLKVRTYERVVSLEREDEGFVVRTVRAQATALNPTPANTGAPVAGKNVYEKGGTGGLSASVDGFGDGFGDSARAGKPPVAPNVDPFHTRTIRARNIVLAVGDMHRPRRLNIPGEDLPHVSHYFDEPHRYFGQRLLIVGGRNSAVEAALRCHHAGAQVSVSYRRDAFDEQSIKYWLLPEIESLIKHERIGFHPCTAPTRITQGYVELGAVTPDMAAKIATPAAVLEADFVLLLTGYEMDPWLFTTAGVELEGENRSPRIDPETMETNVPGLYVAGTAAAGTQVRFRLFIENCHPHVNKIVRALTGSPPPAELVNQAASTFGLPES